MSQRHQLPSARCHGLQRNIDINIERRRPIHDALAFAYTAYHSVILIMTRSTDRRREMLLRPATVMERATEFFSHSTLNDDEYSTEWELGLNHVLNHMDDVTVFVNSS